MEDSPSLTPAADVDRGARLAGALIAAAQNLAVLAAFVTLFGLGELSWACVAVGSLAGLEIADLLIARRARQRVRGLPASPRNVVRLRQRDRRLIVFALVLLPLVAALLAIDVRPANASVLVVAALTAATLTPGGLTLVRVLRYDTWFAVSRLALVQRDMTPPSGGGRRKRPPSLATSPSVMATAAPKTPSAPRPPARLPATLPAGFAIPENRGGLLGRRLRGARRLPAQGSGSTSCLVP